MSRYGLWGIAATAALIAAPLARADDRNAHGSSSSSNATTPSSSTSPSSATTSTEPGSTDAARTGNPEGTTPSSSTGSTSATASRHDDSDIIKSLYNENVFEIEASKIAEKNAQSKDVKDFAKQMEKDHSSLNDKLAKLAKDRNVKLDEDQAKKEHQAHLDQMKQTKGAAMDRHFASMMTAGHEKDLNEVNQALSRVRENGDNELASILETAKTKMQEHHRIAMSLEHGGQQRMGRRPSSSSSETAPSSTSGTSGSSSTDASKSGEYGTGTSPSAQPESENPHAGSQSSSSGK